MQLVFAAANSWSEIEMRVNNNTLLGWVEFAMALGKQQPRVSLSWGSGWQQENSSEMGWETREFWKLVENQFRLGAIFYLEEESVPPACLQAGPDLEMGQPNFDQPTCFLWQSVWPRR